VDDNVPGPVGAVVELGRTGAIAELSRGDVVLFTGDKRVRGIGEVGVVLQSAAFADSIWHPHPDRGSYLTVYSLLSFQSTLIPYQTVREVLGSSKGDNLMGLRLIRDDERIGSVLELGDRDGHG
jgi:hypothetical protein